MNETGEMSSEILLGTSESKEPTKVFDFGLRETPRKKMPGNRVICSDMTGKWKPRRFGMKGNPRSEIISVP